MIETKLLGMYRRLPTSLTVMPGSFPIARRTESVANERFRPDAACISRSRKVRFTERSNSTISSSRLVALTGLFRTERFILNECTAVQPNVTYPICQPSGMNGTGQAGSILTDDHESSSNGASRRSRRSIAASPLRLI